MRFVFDFIIFFILFFSAYWMYVLIRSFFYDKENKTKLWRLGLMAFLTLCFLAVFWGSFIEPQRLVVRHVPINLGTTTEQGQIKIALLTDFHLGPYKKTYFVKKIIKQVIKQNPDIVLLGGDYILGGDGSNAKYLAPLKSLSERYPVYAVTGNHEYHLGDENDPHFIDRTATLRVVLSKLNIKLLENKTTVITAGGAKFNLTGLPEIWTHKANFSIAEINQNPLLPNVLLVHNPEIILDKQTEKYNLILSGHTHAGQIRLPLAGSLPPLPTKLGRAFDRGLFETKNGYLYISSGLGESGARARLFNPPEITILSIDL